MIFILSFSVLWPYFPQFRFFAPFLIFHFLYTCLEVSVSVFFAFLIFFNLFHTIASSFMSCSINQSCSCCFFEKTLFFCSYLLYLGLLISALGLLYFSLLDLFSLGTFLGLGWVEILLLLLLCIGFWGELADQGEAQ